MSQASLAEKAGISITFLSDIERGNKWPYLDTLVRLAGTLNTEIFELLKPASSVDPDAADLMTRYTKEAAAMLPKAVEKLIKESLENLRRQYLKG